MPKTRVGQIGAITCRSGIATVINTVTSSDKLQEQYKFLFFNTTKYKDGNLYMNFIIFANAFFSYLISIMKKKIELAHIHTSFGRSFYRKLIFIHLSSLFRVKILLHFHTGRFEKYFINSYGLKRWLIKSSLKKTDSIIVLCREWRSELKKTFNVENIFVIYNPLSLDHNSLEMKAWKPNPEIFKILYFGFIINLQTIAIGRTKA